MHEVLSHQEAATPQSRSGAIFRRVFLRLVGVVAATAALGGCVTAATGRGPHGGDSSELVYQDWRTDWFSGHGPADAGDVQRLPSEHPCLLHA